MKAVQAAVAKEPTAVLLRAVKANDGTYRVAMRRTDGTRITLTLDANLAVAATQEHAAKPQRTSKPTTTGTASQQDAHQSRPARPPSSSSSPSAPLSAP